MHCSRPRSALVFALVASSLAISPAAAGAGTKHTVVAGETLWGIASANGMSAEDIAAVNGLAPDAQVIAGSTVEIPSAASATPPPGYVAIHHPSETPYLTAEAAAAWEAMREESLRLFGVDLYPRGALSGYRTYAQQAHLYDRYLEGHGAPAAQPGSSSHELGTAVDVPTPEMRDAIDRIGERFGWRKVEAPSEWWHVNYVGGYGG